jgi:hypothetical protein
LIKERLDGIGGLDKGGDKRATDECNTDEVINGVEVAGNKLVTVDDEPSAEKRKVAGDAS